MLITSVFSVLERSKSLRFSLRTGVVFLSERELPLSARISPSIELYLSVNARKSSVSETEPSVRMRGTSVSETDPSSRLTEPLALVDTLVALLED